MASLPGSALALILALASPIQSLASPSPLGFRRDFLRTYVCTHFYSSILGDRCEQMIVLRGPGDQVASEGYELVGVAVQERVAVASPFHPDLRV